MQISASERKTLEVIADRDLAAPVPRIHLERLSRLGLIEPRTEGVCMTVAGKKVLFGRR